MTRGLRVAGACDAGAHVAGACDAVGSASWRVRLAGCRCSRSPSPRAGEAKRARRRGPRRWRSCRWRIRSRSARWCRGLRQPKTGSAIARRLSQRAIGSTQEPSGRRYDLGAILGNAGDLAGSEEQLAMATKLSPDSQTWPSRSPKEAPPGRAEGRPRAVRLARTIRTRSKRAPCSSVSLRESGCTDKAIAEAREVLVRKAWPTRPPSPSSLSHLRRAVCKGVCWLAGARLEPNSCRAPRHRAPRSRERRRRRSVRRVPQGGGSRPARHDVAFEHGRRAPPRRRVRKGRGAIPRDPEGLTRRHASAGNFAAASAAGSTPRTRSASKRPAPSSKRCWRPTPTRRARLQIWAPRRLPQKAWATRVLLQAIPGRRAGRPSPSRRRREVLVRRAGQSAFAVLGDAAPTPPPPHLPTPRLPRRRRRR